jgi:pre-mRNA-processing factor SLU7
MSVQRPSDTNDRNSPVTLRPRPSTITGIDDSIIIDDLSLSLSLSPFPVTTQSSKMASTVPSHTTESVSDRKKSREMAEARQSGAMAPEVDVKTGNMINPHNPDFITKRPWYLGGSDAGPSLDHQTVDKDAKDRVLLSMSSADHLVKEERRRLKQQQSRGKLEAGMWVEALKYNKGTYKMCQISKISKKGTQFDLKYEDGTVERKVKFKASKKKLFSTKPRIRMTKTGVRTVQVDTSVHGHETYDSKRDKYHGYDHDSHTKRIEKTFQDREAMRKQRREKEKKERALNPEKDDEKEKEINSDSDLDSDVEDDDSDDEFVQKDEDDRGFTTRLARQGGVGGAQMKVTARNLRIREDTAKYLRNLDPNSAYYDPRSRSMRDNPNPEIPAEEAQFAGDNFARISGDAVNFAQTQLFAWDASTQSRTDALHPQANPSQVELLKKKFQDKSSQIAIQKKRAVLDKYGGSEYLDGSGGLASVVEKKSTKKDDFRKIRFGVSTVNQEYSRDGRLLKGASAKPKQVPLKSKYEEDICPNGHTDVWGSYFHISAFQWGFADDHSLIKNSFGTGENGRRANDRAHALQYGTGAAGSAALEQARGMLKAIPKGNQSGNSSNNAPSSRSKLYGEADQGATFDKDKLKKALEEFDRKDDEEKKNDSRKRKYNSVESNVDVTEEQMEAYRLRKERSADPMSQINSDELLDYK